MTLHEELICRNEWFKGARTLFLTEVPTAYKVCSFKRFVITFSNAKKYRLVFTGSGSLSKCAIKFLRLGRGQFCWML